MSTSVNIPIEKVDSVSGLLSRIVELYTGNRSILFRGHRCEDWVLVPRIARTPLRVSYSADPLKTEQYMLDEFERLAVPYLGNRDITSVWDRLALAQHHGLPTRLMDWTSNPLVALWFAIEQPPERNMDAAIWAYGTDEDDIVSLKKSPFDLPRTLIFRPRHHDSRIVAQSGWFTVHKYMVSGGHFSSLERIKTYRSELRKFVIPKQYFASLRDDLARCGIQRAALFPDLSGLCGQLLWHFSPLSDETKYDVSSSL